jgi:hypothetical protein
MNAVPIGIDITGLDAEDQARILAVGLSPWMDEVASRPKLKSTAPEPSQSKLRMRNCTECGKPFPAKRADARYCSPRCRVRVLRGNAATLASAGRDGRPESRNVVVPRLSVTDRPYKASSGLHPQSYTK